MSQTDEFGRTYESLVLWDLSFVINKTIVHGNPYKYLPSIRYDGNGWTCESDYILIPQGVREEIVSVHAPTPTEAFNKYINTLIEFGTRDYIAVAESWTV